MRKLVLAVAVAATLPGLTAGDQPEEPRVQRSPGGTQPTDKTSDRPKVAAEEGKVQKPGTKQADKWSPSQNKQAQKPVKETVKLGQSKPAQNPGAKEPGKLEKHK